MRLDEALVTRLRAQASGHEQEIVDFCLRYDMSLPKEEEYTEPIRHLRQGLSAVLEVMQEETLDGFRRAFATTDGNVAVRVRTRLKSWIGYTTMADGFRFGVDRLIDDTTPSEPPGELWGAPRRICDHVYNTVARRMAPGTPFAGVKDMGNEVRLAERDRLIQEMKSWWEASKGNLVWNAATRKFEIASQASETNDEPRKE